MGLAALGIKFVNPGGRGDRECRKSGQAEECSAMSIVSLAGFTVGPACSEFSVLVEDGESDIVDFECGCGAGVPSRSPLADSLSEVAGVLF